MLVVRALYDKLLPKPITPKEAQLKIDITRLAVLTAVYGKRRNGHEVNREQILRDVEAMTHKKAKIKVQGALNDQIVEYFDIVLQASEVHPPPQKLLMKSSTKDPDKYGGLIASKPKARRGPSARQDRLRAMASAQQFYLELWEKQNLHDMVRKRLGYCPIVKKSTIPGAGEGLFVEGHAPEGSVVAIHPGLVHLPEYLTKKEYIDTLLPDEDFMMMGRADGSVVDGRTADELPFSPFAVAHKVNHPPAGQSPNVLQAPYDYPSVTSKDIPGATDRGRGFFPRKYRDLVPNRYKEGPRPFGGKIDRFPFTETIVLVAGRGGVKNEEVFMDYRFNPAMETPSWYTPIDPEALRFMWGLKEETGNDTEDEKKKERQ